MLAWRVREKMDIIDKEKNVELGDKDKEGSNMELVDKKTLRWPQAPM